MCEPPFLHTAASFLCFPGVKRLCLHTADAFLGLPGVKWPFLHTTLSSSGRPEVGLSQESSRYAPPPTALRLWAPPAPSRGRQYSPRRDPPPTLKESGYWSLMSEVADNARACADSGNAQALCSTWNTIVKLSIKLFHVEHTIKTIK